MTCFNPLIIHLKTKIDGKRFVDYSISKERALFEGQQKLVEAAEDSGNEDFYQVPCRRCIGCRIDYSKQWAIRCYHESTLYEDNCFLTLTYNDQFLPPGETLVKKHIQDFMKRLRKLSSNRIRYFYCGEYGSTFGRPHYHMLLFNFDFPDKQLFYVDKGVRYYTSDLAAKLWPMGFSILGDVTFDSAAYTARYITKKIYGSTAEAHYHGRLPEYTNCSLKPGIGYEFCKKYLENIYTHDRVICKGTKMLPPKYYDKILEQVYPVWAEWLKSDRRDRFADKFDNTLERLQAREICREAYANSFPRNLEKQL